MIAVAPHPEAAIADRLLGRSHSQPADDVPAAVRATVEDDAILAVLDHAIQHPGVDADDLDAGEAFFGVRHDAGDGEAAQVHRDRPLDPQGRTPTS